MKICLFAFSLLFFLVSCNENGGSSASEAKAQSLQLKLKINDFSNDFVKLIGFYGDQNFAFDSVMADAKGNVLFKRDTPIFEGMYFIVFPDQSFAQMMLNKQQQFTLEFSKADIVNTMIVKGSTENELLYKNLKFESDISKKFEAIQKQLDAATKGTPEYEAAEKEQTKLVEERKAHIQWFAENHPNAFFTKFKIAGQNPDLRNPKRSDGTIDEELQVYHYRNDFWTGVDFADVRLLRTPVYFNKLKRYMKELTPQVADSLIKYATIVTEKSKADKEIFKFTANWIALNYRNTKIMGLEAVYVHMVDRYWTENQAWWSNKEEIDGLRREVDYMKPSLIGQPGQDIRAKNERDEYISLYDLKAPIIVLFIFSYECDNCKKETPKLVKVYHEWKNRGVDVFTLSIDADKEEWKQYLKKNNMTFHNVFDFDRESRYHRKYHIDVTPEIYVLNKDRKIIASNIDSDQLPKIFERELGL